MQGGAIKRKDKDRDYPWPEFWPGYNACVRERDELAVHIEYGVFPDHLIRSRSPNQTDAEFEYVRANFKQVTLPNYIDFENTIRRAMHESNWRIEYRENGGEDFRDYTMNRIGELGDYILWAQNLLPKMKTLDPMGIICTMPVRVPTIEGVDEEGNEVLLINPNERVEPQPNYFPVDRVWGYEHGVWYCLRTNERSRVKVGGSIVEQGIVMWIVDSEKCYRVEQTGEAWKMTFAITEHFEHGQGYPPCIFLMGTPTLKDGRVIHQSVYLPSKPSFDTVLLDTTYLMMVKSNSAYPYRVMLGNQCNYVGTDMGHCVGGNLTYVEEGGRMAVHGKCPKCNGTGLAARLGPNGVLFVEEAKRGDTTTPSVHDAMTFVEPTSTTMDFLRREIVDQTNEGRKVMHLSTETPIDGGESKTATQSGIDNKGTMAFIKPIAQQIFAVIDFTLDCMATQRYGKEVADEIYTLIPAMSFDLRTESDYMAEIAASATLPPPLRQVVLEGYINTRYSGDATMKEAFEAIILADRLFALTPMEIAAMQAQKAVEPWEVALHNDALAVYERLAQDGSFLALDKFAKADALRAAAKEASGATASGGQDLAQRLVAQAQGATQPAGEDDTAMIEGVIEILRDIADMDNRRTSAERRLADFEREGVAVDRADFLARVMA